MRIKLKSLFVASAIAVTTNSLSAEQCPTNNNKVIFVNGIQNTLRAARKSKEKLEDILASSQTRAASDKRKFEVDLIWNPIGFTGRGSVFTTLPQDLRELMVEKTSEELFAVDFRKLLSPHNSPKVIDKVAAQRVKQYLDDMTPGGTTPESNGDIKDSNLTATQDVIRSLVASFNTNKRAIVVAHSQGNLLANLAWASYASDVTTDPNQNVRIVNVGNTSQFSVNSLNITHFNDLAIGELIQLPKTKSWKRTTPNCTNDLCEFQVASATFNGAKGTDYINHGFTETYLSTQPLPEIAKDQDQGVTFTTGKTRFVDRFEDLVYAAATSLDRVQGVLSGEGMCLKVESISCTREQTENGKNLTHWKAKGYAILPETRIKSLMVVGKPNYGADENYSRKTMVCPQWPAELTYTYTFTCLARPNDPNRSEFTIDGFGGEEANEMSFNITDVYYNPISTVGVAVQKSGLACPGYYTYK